MFFRENEFAQSPVGDIISVVFPGFEATENVMTVFLNLCLREFGSPKYVIENVQYSVKILRQKASINVYRFRISPKQFRLAPTDSMSSAISSRVRFSVPIVSMLATKPEQPGKFSGSYNPPAFNRPPIATVLLKCFSWINKVNPLVSTRRDTGNSPVLKAGGRWLVDVER